MDVIESEWSKIASQHADKVVGGIGYYKAESDKCAFWQRRLSILALALASSTTVFISLATIWKDTPSGDVLQVLSIFVAASVSIVEGLARIFAFDKRWASNYLALWALRKSRSDYKIKRIGLVGEEWQKAFKTYVNRYYAIIGKENSEFFALIPPVDRDPDPTKP